MSVPRELPRSAAQTAWGISADVATRVLRGGASPYGEMEQRPWCPGALLVIWSPSVWMMRPAAATPNPASPLVACVPRKADAENVLILGAT